MFTQRDLKISVPVFILVSDYQVFVQIYAYEAKHLLYKDNALILKCLHKIERDWTTWQVIFAVSVFLLISIA